MTRCHLPLATLWVLSVIAGSGCDGMPVDPSPIQLTGTWGGDHVSLTVTDMSSHLEFDCAHGDIAGAVTADAGGAFVAAGTFVREHGGPIREGEIPDAHPATYVGAASATTMRLTVRLSETGEIVGTFTLTRGTPGRVLKCL